MMCYKCGRELSEGAKRCKGCGTVLVRPARRHIGVRKTFTKLMRTTAVVGGWKVWQFSIALLSTVVVLASVAIFAPGLVESIKKSAESATTTTTTVATAAPDTRPTVAKTGMVLLVEAGADAQLIMDEAYEDGTCYQQYVIDGVLRIDNRRMPHSEAGLLGHSQTLYPDLIEQPQMYTDAITLGEYSVQRAQIPAFSNAENCIIDLVMVATGEYDQVLCISVPSDLYVNYKGRIEGIVSTIALGNYTIASASDIA